MSVFYLVRHAHADWSEDENRPLSLRGHRDSIRVADVLQNYPIGLILSSPYMRSVQTVSLLAVRLCLPVHIEPELREKHLGNSETGDFFKAVEATWEDPFFAHPGGESNIEAQKRGLSVLYRLQEEYLEEHIVLSTHGNLLALILQGFNASIDFAFWKSLTMPDIYLLIPDRFKPSIRRLWWGNMR